MSMSVQVNPPYFRPPESFRITVIEGTPPFTYTPWTNPPGVVVLPNGATADVTVPESTPPGTKVRVDVTDSSEPPVTRTAQATTT